jgi:queuine tRNA-ribosyltransferase
MAIQFTVAASDGRARTGTLTTPHGSVPTPAFMAVGTLGGLKGITVQQARAAGCGILLGNPYHLQLRPGPEVVQQLGGLQVFSGWRGPMLTDSGGYQVFSLATMRRIDEDGVHFKSHLDGTALTMTAESSIATQRRLGAGIIIAFGESPPADASHDYASANLERCLRWLDRSVAAWRKADEPPGGLPGGPATQALYGIIQGGVYPDLRARSARETVARDLPGFAIGGLAVGESAAVRNQTLDTVVPLMPADKPRYLMGVGTPLDLVEAVWRGVDQFDCVLPTRMGRHGIAYTDDGPLRLMRLEHRTDPRPIDPATPSEASDLSRGYLRHLLKSGEMLGGQLVSLHNLAYYQRLMTRLREAITAGTLDAFVADFRIRYHA